MPTWHGAWLLPGVNAETATAAPPTARQRDLMVAVEVAYRFDCQVQCVRGPPRNLHVTALALSVVRWIFIQTVLVAALRGSSTKNRATPGQNQASSSDAPSRHRAMAHPAPRAISPENTTDRCRRNKSNEPIRFRHSSGRRNSKSNQSCTMPIAR
jgi:hypothetical protein